MAKKEKIRLCKLAKKEFINTNLKEYSELVKSPKFVCTKCGRASGEKKYICKPVELK